MLETQITGAVPLSFFFFWGGGRGSNFSRECSGYYIHRQYVYSLPAGEVIKRVTYIFLYFGNTLFAIGHTLGVSHKQNMQDKLQFAILANLKMA